MMHELSFLTALLAGLFGSTHCLGMCGGIATALGAASDGRRAWQPLLYHGGRILGYCIAGSITGALGAAAGLAFAISQWSAILRLGTALIVILIGLDISLGAGARALWLRAPERWGAWLWRRLAPARRLPMPSAPRARALLLGLLWGWLPCGLVYSVLLAAAVAGGARAGALTMLGFGLGTLPAMSTLSYAGSWLPRRDGLMARMLGAVLVACGLWTAIVPLAAISGSQQHRHHAMPAAQADDAGVAANSSASAELSGRHASTTGVPDRPRPRPWY